MIKHKRWQLRPLVFAVVFLLGTISTSILSTRTASAAISDVPKLLYSTADYQELSTHQHYWWLYSCFKNVDIDKTTEAEIDNWEFFKGNSQESALGQMYGGDGLVECDNGGVVDTAFGYLGQNDPRQAFCALTGATYGGEEDQAKCLAGTGSRDWDNNATRSEVASSFAAQYKDPGMDSWAVYMRAYATFTQRCQITYTDSKEYDKASDVPGANPNDGKYAVPVVVKDGDKYVVKYMLGVGTAQCVSIMVANSNTTDVGTNSNGVKVGPWTTANRTELLSLVSGNALAYAAHLSDNAPDKDTGGGATGGGTADPVCEVNGFGWVICPLINTLGEVTNAVAEFLGDYLRVEPLTLDTSNVIYKGWRNLLGVANVALLIAFLFLIFSQATSVGISNYGIKKMLPRIIAAAILINISYYLCAIAVDLSNIAGAGIANLIYNNLGDITSSSQENGLVGGIKETAGSITAGLIGVSGLIVVAFFFLIPAVLAILSIFVVVAARSAIITLLIIVAPLAFAAWVLPNTDKYFRKWWDLFLQMLLIYPAIMAIFAAASAASTIVVDATAARTGSTPGPGNLFPLLIGLIIQALPLLALPALIKLTSGALARIEGMARANMKKGGGDKLSQMMRDRTATIAKERQARIAEKYDKDFQSKDSAGKTRRTRTAFGRAAGWAARSPYRKMEWEERKANAEQAFKTGYEEQRVTDPEGRAAQNAERKFQLEQRGISAAQQHKLDIAGKVQSDDEFTAAAAGVMGQRGEARIRGAANTAVVKDRAEEVETHASMQTRNSALLTATGVGYDGTSLKATRNVVGKSGTAYTAGQVLTHGQAGDIAGIPIDDSKGETIDASSLDGLQYATQNHLTESNAGVRSVIAQLSSTGALDSQHLQQLMDGLKAGGANATELGYVAEFANDKARSAGLKHLSYNNVDAGGNFKVGGAFGGPDGAVNRVMQDGVAKITKEMYADSQLGSKVAAKVRAIQDSSPELFATELPKMTPRQIEYLAKAQADAGLMPLVYADAKGYADELKRQQGDAIAKYGVTS